VAQHIISHFLLQHPKLPPFAPELRATFCGFLFSEPIADVRRPLQLLRLVV
jgi:hypothetical protein